MNTPNCTARTTDSASSRKHIAAGGTAIREKIGGIPSLGRRNWRKNWEFFLKKLRKNREKIEKKLGKNWEKIEKKIGKKFGKKSGKNWEKNAGKN